MGKMNGLSSKEAAELLKKNGLNTLKEEKQKTIFQMLMEQLLNVTTFIFLAVIVICCLIHEYSDAVIVGIVIVANAIIGIVQEGKAQKALDALKQMTKLRAMVIRDGEIKEISSEELVVGDYVVIDAGRQIPADLKLIETVNLKIDEKALTGESVSVDKDCNYVPSNEDGIGDRLDI